MRIEPARRDHASRSSPPDALRPPLDPLANMWPPVAVWMLFVPVPVPPTTATAATATTTGEVTAELTGSLRYTIP